jgi:hypothetical protein
MKKLLARRVHCRNYIRGHDGGDPHRWLDGRSAGSPSSTDRHVGAVRNSRGPGRIAAMYDSPGHAGQSWRGSMMSRNSSQRASGASLLPDACGSYTRPS